jgi:hypothetical protein
MRGPENLGTDGRPLDPSRTLPFSLAAWSASLVATTASAEPTYSRVNEKTREESLVVALVVLTILFVVMMSLIARGPR